MCVCVCVKQSNTFSCKLQPVCDHPIVKTRTLRLSMLNDSPKVPRRASWVVQLVKKLPANAGDLGLIPGLGRYSEGGNGTLVFLSGETHG